MNDVKLGDNTYEGVQAVMMDTPDGGTVTFVEQTDSPASAEAELALTLWKERSKSTNLCYMFHSCTTLKTIPLFDSTNANNISYMFSNCTSLEEVPSLDIRNATPLTSMFYNCKSLMECRLRNIKANLTAGSGNSYGHLLSVDSLIHLIYELRDTGSVKTLAIGNTNLSKIANTYVKIVDITDEMRAEDDLIDEKLPFAICESTDDGAMLITDYASEKNWQIQ